MADSMVGISIRVTEYEIKYKNMPAEKRSEVYLGKIEKIYPLVEEKTKKEVGGMSKTSFD